MFYHYSYALSWENARKTWHERLFQNCCPHPRSPFPFFWGEKMKEEIKKIERDIATLTLAQKVMLDTIEAILIRVEKLEKLHKS